MSQASLHSVSRARNPLSGFDRWANLTGMSSPHQLIGAAYPSLAQDACECGIDWASLQSRMPEEGTLLKGSSIPVLDRKDQWRCAFVWHLWTDRSGNQWPLLIFMSFRHGGIQRVFYGYRWAREVYFGRVPGPASSPRLQRRIVPRSEGDHASNDESWRMDRYRRHTRTWEDSAQASSNHTMLVARLHGLASPELLKRVDLRSVRCKGDDALMVKLLSHANGRTGYQLLHAASPGERKQTVVIRQSGLKRGSMVCIRAVAGHEMWPVAVCEGVFTALSVAAFWPGPLAVALDAGNLKPVRDSITRSCVFFGDDDNWSDINTGRTKVQQAMRANDRSVFPRFSQRTAAFRPTDFNDLLQHEGPGSLEEQVKEAWPSFAGKQ